MIRFLASSLALATFGAALALTGASSHAQSIEDELSAPGCVSENWRGAPDRANGDAYAGSRTALVDLLSVAPYSQTGMAGAPILSYVDLDAVVRAGLERVRPNASVATQALVDLVPALRRANTGPYEYMSNFFVLEETMPETLGVGISDIGRGIEIGKPPAVSMIFGLVPNADVGDAMEAALSERGFDRQMEHGVAVWHRFDDNEISITDRNGGDPFWGQLGRASRIFLFENALAGAPAWPLAREMVAAAINKEPSMADHVTMCALVAAVTPDDGALLQFVVLNPADVMMLPASLQVDGDGAVELVVPPGADGELPPYQLAAMADRHNGDVDEALVALVYRDDTQASEAARVLADRLTAFDPASRPGAWAGLFDDLGAEITANVVAASDDGPYAAVAKITYRADFPTDETEDGLAPVGGRIFRMLWDAVLRRELTPLVVL